MSSKPNGPVQKAQQEYENYQRGVVDLPMNFAVVIKKTYGGQE